MAQQQPAGSLRHRSRGPDTNWSALLISPSGYKVLVLEGRPTSAAAARLRKCAACFKEDLAPRSRRITGEPIAPNNELGLRDYGLEYIDPTRDAHPFVDGASITLA